MFGGVEVRRDGGGELIYHTCWVGIGRWRKRRIEEEKNEVHILICRLLIINFIQIKLFIRLIKGRFTKAIFFTRKYTLLMRKFSNI